MPYIKPENKQIKCELIEMFCVLYLYVLVVFLKTETYLIKLKQKHI